MASSPCLRKRERIRYLAHRSCHFLSHCPALHIVLSSYRPSPISHCPLLVAHHSYLITRTSSLIDNRVKCIAHRPSPIARQSSLYTHHPIIHCSIANCPTFQIHCSIHHRPLHIAYRPSPILHQPTAHSSIAHLNPCQSSLYTHRPIIHCSIANCPSTCAQCPSTSFTFS